MTRQRTKKKYIVSLDETLTENIKENIDNFSELINDFLYEYSNRNNNNSDETPEIYILRQEIGTLNIELGKIRKLKEECNIKEPRLIRRLNSIQKEIEELKNKKIKEKT